MTTLSHTLPYLGTHLFSGVVCKMATSSQGYKCEFIDSVPEDFYCRKCTLVARRLVYTSCCEETFCYTCIVDSKNQDKPCSVCGEEEFAMVEFKKYQNKVKQLQVYCNMKERGCVWSGTLDQLDSHLDPDLDYCQYVDKKCPLNCPQVIPKNKVEQHVAQECSKRPHICQHCGFKATYEEVVNKHLQECKYVALQCPNMCGVSCERGVMEDHMKICRLEEVECEFKGVGCKDRFIREDQEEHTRDNSLKHLTLTATLAVESKEQLGLKLQEQMIEAKNLNKEQEKKIMDQEKKLGEQEKKLGEHRKKLEEQEKKLGEQEKKLGEQEKKLGEQEKKLGEPEKKLGEQEKKLGVQEKMLGEPEKKLGEQEKKLGVQEKMLGEQEKKLGEQEKKLGEQEKNIKMLQQELQGSKQILSLCSKYLILNRKFEMQNFSKEKKRDDYSKWKTPAMYSNIFGYKFCIGVYANGYRAWRGKAIEVGLWSMPGEFDHLLRWPAEGEITIELINQQGGENAKGSVTFTWKKPSLGIQEFRASIQRNMKGFINHSKLDPFLANDTLFFRITNIK